jgi:hypothetical protein
LTTRFVSAQTLRLLALALLATGTVVYGILPGRGERAAGDQLKLKINETVEQLWERADGPVLRQDVDRAWTWGPEPITTSTEFYPESPSGLRTLVYYDKGRLDILDPGANTADEWYAVGGLLVSEMLSGQVQLGEARFVARITPEIPLTGDFGQPQPVTYATLARFSSAWQPSGDGEDLVAAAERQVVDRTGQPVSVHLDGGGVLTPAAVDPAGVIYAGYDATTGHNIANVFADWAAAQPYRPLYLLGHPVSEPYWIDTVVNGAPQRTLVQAFERRVMTYTPGNPAGWQVESANVGRHYRAWRGLPEITDPALMPLAAGEPFGEEITGAALAHGIDPFMLAAIAKATSSGDPSAQSANGGRGLLAVSPQLHDVPALDALLDPGVNADNGARGLKFWTPDVHGQSVAEGAEQFDWRAVLANYYTNGNVDWNAPALQAFVQGALDAYGKLKEAYPPLEADPVDQRVWGGLLDAGQAAFYDPSYTPAWWERTQLLYARKGLVAASHEPDPNGYYCVRPGYIPGEQLRLRANGVTITCTIGDMVADQDLHNWLLASNWAVELNWDAFTALGLQHYNYVEVDFPGPWAKRTPPIPPPPAPEPTPVPAEQPAAVPALPANPPDAGQPDPEPTPTN